MVECGTIESPPSFTNVTVWGIITMICMLFVGISSIYGVIGSASFGSDNFFFDLINLIGSCFGVAGLIFAILSIVQKNAAHMRIGMTCYFISCLIALVVFILSLIFWGKVEIRSIFHLLLCIFLCYLFFVQSKNMGASA